jgi:hypothetical protein
MSAKTASPVRGRTFGVTWTSEADGGFDGSRSKFTNSC